MREMQWFTVGLVVALACSPGAAKGAGLADESPHSHDAVLSVPTDDPVLKEQIVKVHEALEMLHQQMAERRRQLQRMGEGSAKAVAYAELDGLRKEHDLLERLLHDLVDEARATEWTAIDEALRRVRPYEQRQEKVYQREEALRDRQS